MIQHSASHSGNLYIIATPIGNRQDISARAIEVLQQVDTILTEDTRHSQPLLHYLGIQKPLISFHAHNESDKTQMILNALQEGRSYALISDAGTPLISDPGYPLVHEARQLGLSVIPIPGACAFVTALSAAGVPCEPMSFFGFLPAKSSARCEKLSACLALNHTLVFYESTHRILACIDDLMTLLGDTCELVLAKELTKAYERFITGPLSEVKAWLMADPRHSKGEFVIIIPPRPLMEKAHNAEAILRVLLEELPLKQAVALAAKISQEPKNELYQLALSWQT